MSSCEEKLRTAPEVLDYVRLLREDALKALYTLEMLSTSVSGDKPTLLEAAAP